MDLRSMVIAELLIIEKKSKDLLQLIFRIFEHNTKTLGNSSSSLSLNTKIDFLFDLKDLSSEEYNGFKKLMEIRNQFAHNADANSFIQLNLFNPQLNSYLKKNYPNEFVNLENEEQNYLDAFLELSRISRDKIDELIVAYKSGFDAEMKGKFSYKAINNFIDVIKLAFTSFKSNHVDNKAFEKHFEELAENLKIALRKDSLLDSVNKDIRIKKEINSRKLK